MHLHRQEDKFQREAAGFSLFWLMLANGVGLLLASLLVWPQLGRYLGPLSYGRWMPLHMEWQLYGWCSMPLVSVLVAWIADRKDRLKTQRWVLGLWSSGLLVGGIVWLSGQASGKLFLNWHGFGRYYWIYVLLIIWLILLRLWYIKGRGHWLCWDGILQAGVLFVLACVPVSLWWTTGRTNYPPIDPESGGATGHSLLASTLGIVFMFGAMREWVLKLLPPSTWHRVLFWGYFALCGAGYVIIDHGNASNKSLNQVLGLSLLCGWVPIFWLYFARWTRRPDVGRWVRAFLFWWSLLCISGVLSFLPPVLQVWKYTNGLVAHAHLAMAGMVSSYLLSVLGLLGRRKHVPWSGAVGFSLWNAGLLLMVVVLGIQGWREGTDPEVLWVGNTGTTVLYSLRWVAGLCLLTASVMWWRKVFTVEAWAELLED